MGLTSEIYLTKKFVSKEEWLELINTISNRIIEFKSDGKIIDVMYPEKIDYNVQKTIEFIGNNYLGE